MYKINANKLRRKRTGHTKNLHPKYYTHQENKNKTQYVMLKKYR